MSSAEDPAAVDAVDQAAPAWRAVAERIQAEHRAASGGPVEEPDPADFDLDDDCCLGGCCAKGTAYLEAVERAAAARAARGSA